MARRIAKSAYLLAAEARDRTTPSLELYIDFGYVRRLAALARKVFVFRVVVTNCSDAQNSLKTIRLLIEHRRADGPPSHLELVEDLDRVIGSPGLMPPGTDIQPMGRREYGLLAPGMTGRLRVTTDPEYFEEHAQSLELWSPGNPLFTPPEFTTRADEPPAGKTLKDILDG